MIGMVSRETHRHDMVAGFTTEDAEFMLEGDDIELTCIQEVGSSCR